jgi:hypothetical protein
LGIIEEQTFAHQLLFQVLQLTTDLRFPEEDLEEDLEQPEKQSVHVVVPSQFIGGRPHDVDHPQSQVFKVSVTFGVVFGQLNGSLEHSRHQIEVMVGRRQLYLLRHLCNHPIQQIELGSFVSQEIEEDRTLTYPAKVHRLTLHAIQDRFRSKTRLDQRQTAEQP